MPTALQVLQVHKCAHRPPVRPGAEPLSDLKTALYIPWRGRWRLTQLTGVGLLRRATPRQKAALDRPRRLAAIESPARCVVYAHAQRGARRRSLATGDKRASEALCVGVDRPAVSVAAAQVQLSQRGAAAQRREGAGDSARRQVIIVVPLDEEPFEGGEEGGGVCGRHVQRAVVGEARRGDDAGRKSIDIRPPSA